MNAAKNKERTILKPFDDINTAIEMLAYASGLSRQDVTLRLKREHQRLGRNVSDELDEWGIIPYQWSDRLIEYYGQSKAFLFETFVWNSASTKQSLRQWIVRYLKPKADNPIRVLVYGDGLMFDSTYLALAGCDAAYFEMGWPCVEFAKRVFRLNNVEVEIVANLDELP